MEREREKKKRERRREREITYNSGYLRDFEDVQLLLEGRNLEVEVAVLDVLGLGLVPSLELETEENKECFNF